MDSIPNADGIIVKHYFFASVLGPQGPGNILAQGDSEDAFTCSLIANGITPIIIKTITEDQFKAYMGALQHYQNKLKGISIHKDLPPGLIKPN